MALLRSSPTSVTTRSTCRLSHLAYILPTNVPHTPLLHATICPHDIHPCWTLCPRDRGCRPDHICRPCCGLLRIRIHCPTRRSGESSCPQKTTGLCILPLLSRSRAPHKLLRSPCLRMAGAACAEI